jgi:presenilin-like A22 family membrane protease
MDQKVQDSLERLRGFFILECFSIFTWLAGIIFFYLPLPHAQKTITQSFGNRPTFLENAPVLLFSVLFALGLMYLVRRKRLVAPAVSILLGFMVYGTLSVFIEPLVAFLVCVLLVYVERAYRSFITNNFLVLSGVFAAAMSFAVFYQADFFLTLLGIFAVYDIFGVLFTNVIPKVARGFMNIGAPLLLYVPKKIFRWRDTPEPESIASAMGSGDIFLPLLFLTAVSVQFGILRALWCLFGAIFGGFVNLFFATKRKSGIPAIPFLACGLAIAYLLTR